MAFVKIFSGKNEKKNVKKRKNCLVWYKNCFLFFTENNNIRIHSCYIEKQMRNVMIHRKEENLKKKVKVSARRIGLSSVSGVLKWFSTVKRV
ncbi:MAG: hypothetical protein BWK80_45860 [Desulfobacteraceae bacterium IS3]|nr:MAG: hypothetical protein BWK80_45860 [Desulfobacteraceae bacterium IS3]